MTKKLILLLLSITVGSVLLVSAQEAPKGKMTFKSTVYDFGTFKEELKSVSHAFEFKNTGKQPIIIQRVSASCGCTTPDWTRSPVAPGQKGYIKVTYNARNRPGPFSKTITVVANTVPSRIILSIKGNVTPRVRTIEDLYPSNLSGLRVRTNHLAFTKVKNTEQKTVEIPVYNATETPISIGFRRMPVYLNIKMVPEKLQPKQKGVIVGTFDASKKHDWGSVYDYLNLSINGEFKVGRRIVTSANIVEDFSKLTPKQRAMAPKIELNETVFDFKELNQGEVASHTFKIKNVGKSNLIIRKTKTSCGCTASSPKTKVIAPGASTDLKVTFHSNGKRGRQNKTVTIITNDPVNYSSYLRIIGNVKVPKK